MGFDSEEEIESWYGAEKEKLDNGFMDRIGKDSENIPKHKEQYDTELKKLIAKYQQEYGKLLIKMNRTSKKK
ncbi:MAG: hypothetical protein V1866_06585 [archaeon]